jgi:hypothetical protein
MKNKKLIVCGDSWLAPVPANANIEHFSTILGNLINYKVVPFSRAGSSNKAICLQVESAIKQNPDLIILNTTNIERTEVVFKPLKGEPTVSNLVHPYNDIIKTETENYDPRIVSSGIPDLLENNWQYFKQLTNRLTDSIVDSKKEALKYYITELYDSTWTYKIDVWCWLGIISKLEHSEIPYLLIVDHMDLPSHCPWISAKNTTLPWQYWYNTTKKNISNWEKEHNKKFEEPSWHTLPEDQIVMANLIHEHLLQYELI